MLIHAKKLRKKFQKAESCVKKYLVTASEIDSLINEGSAQYECSRKDSRDKLKKACNRKDCAVTRFLTELCVSVTMNDFGR